MDKIDISKINSLFDHGCIYDGAYDLSSSPKKISINVEDEHLIIDLDKIDNSQDIADNLSIDELKQICELSGIKMILYPDKSFTFRKLDSSEDELKSCYLLEFKKYIMCIAFDEVQPTRYRAEIVSILKK
jgi:hypothetical protein